MSRFVTIVLCALVINCFLKEPSAKAQISRQNPYRSFNVSGVNYGSLRWEQDHKNKNQALTVGMAFS